MNMINSRLTLKWICRSQSSVNGNALWNAKVADFDEKVIAFVLIDENVASLDVSMNRLTTLSMRDGGEDELMTWMAAAYL